MFFAFSNLTGLLRGNSTQQSSFKDLQDCTVFDLATNPGPVYMTTDGMLMPLPPKPGNGYIFNRDTTLWEDFRIPRQVGNIIKKQRLELLQQSDWTQLPDVPLETKTLWQAYRQALRDITEQPGYPFNVEWPTPPQQ